MYREEKVEERRRRQRFLRKNERAMEAYYIGGSALYNLTEKTIAVVVARIAPLDDRD